MDEEPSERGNVRDPVTGERPKGERFLRMTLASADATPKEGSGMSPTTGTTLPGLGIGVPPTVTIDASVEDVLGLDCDGTLDPNGPTGHCVVWVDPDIDVGGGLHAGISDEFTPCP